MFGSYFFSILLHLALALLIFLWPSSPPVKLDQPMMQISVNMGAPGGNRMASPVLGPQGKPMPTKAAPQPAPAEQVEVEQGGVAVAALHQPVGRRRRHGDHPARGQHLYCHMLHLLFSRPSILP